VVGIGFTCFRQRLFDCGRLSGAQAVCRIHCRQISEDFSRGFGDRAVFFGHSLLRVFVFLFQGRACAFADCPVVDSEFDNCDLFRALSKATRAIIDPATRENIAEVAEGARTDARQAIKAAREAFDSGTWPRTSAAERGLLVYELGRLIAAHKEELATLESLNTGKTVEESRWDMDDIAGICDKSGRILGLMPHPERHIEALQHPQRWRVTKYKSAGDGLQIFKNGVDYIKKNF